MNPTRATVETVIELIKQIDTGSLTALAEAACEAGNKREAQRISCLLRLKELSQ